MCIESVYLKLSTFSPHTDHLQLFTSRAEMIASVEFCHCGMLYFDEIIKQNILIKGFLLAVLTNLMKR